MLDPAVLAKHPASISSAEAVAILRAFQAVEAVAEDDSRTYDDRRVAVALGRLLQHLDRMDAIVAGMPPRFG